MNSKNAKFQVRSQRGFSLATVMLIGITAVLWIAALMGTVMPSYRQVAKGRVTNVLRSSAEAALDWAVAELNVTGNNLDDPTNDGVAGSELPVPPDVLGTYGMPSTATVSVANVQPPQSSYLYDPRLDPANAATNGGIEENGWRMVTATAQTGTQQKSVRIILKPNYTNTPTFEMAIFMDHGLTLNGNGLTVDSYDSSVGAYGGSNVSDLGGDIGSNGLINIGNSNVGGSIYSLTNPMNDTTHTVAESGPGAVVTGGVISNALVSNSFDSIAQGRGLPEGTPVVQESLSLEQKDLPPVPSHPSSATYIATIGASGRTATTLAPGDYWCNAISISGSGSIILPASGTVRIFVEGSNPSIQIGGQGFVNSGRPENFQVFTSATSVDVSGNGIFRGVLYAPNADITMRGNGQYYGAVIGHEMSLTGGGSRGGFHYDSSLRTANIFNSTTLSRVQTVSWQELQERQQ
ncbi:MAG: hypothetical protein K2W95_16235 [Candidatus Obscuribacterales bacterium]|nr:hypothetical protein [Candidatus Obscuribacterales bacterium]